MPAHVTPRNLRGDALIDLEGQYDDFAEIVHTMDQVDSVFQQLKARVLRSASKANRKRRKAAASLDAAQRVEDAPWDGKRERRLSDRRRARRSLRAAAEIAAPPSVAA